MSSKTEWRIDLDAIMRRLRIWADNSPENFEHKYLLAAAELARIDGRPGEAVQLYDNAIAAAQAGSFLQWEGMANERAHNFWHECGNEHLAHAYWRQAYVCYERWGAVAKVGSMETAYRTYLAKNPPVSDGSGNPVANLGPEVKNVLVEKQIGQLRNYALQTRQIRLQIEAATRTEDLAHAMDRLRTEIAERKWVEQALRESEEQFRKLFVEAPLGIALIESLTGHIYEVNPAFAKIAGRTREELTQLDWLSITHPDDVQGVLDNMELLNAGKITGFQMEKRYLQHASPPVWIRMTIAPVFVEAKAQRHHLCMIEDITQRKQAEGERAQLEAQLRESQKMEALGTLAGGVAHDFNNALAVIIGNVELARQDVGAAHVALVSLEEISQASRRAKDLVQQILAFGRRQKLERKPTSLALAVVEAARLVRATLPTAVSLKVHCDADTPAVLADAAQIKQILLNLCSNAMQAMEHQAREGVLTVNLSGYTFAPGEVRGDLRPGRYACLAVGDNGTGMDVATRSRIFEPFFTTKPAGQGTGLGLSVIHGIVKAHEACIEVETAFGEGSTFRVYFPAVDVSVPELQAPIAMTAPVRGNGKHVLYVDDEEAIIFLMTRLLERQNYRVSGYTDPREALAAVRANPDQFDLVVTDYNMPGMSGLEVARALREIRADLPVVLVSGYITEELRAKAPAVGVHELIYKPNTVDDLCAAVARCANA